MATLNSITPTVVLIVSTLINHVFKENKQLTLRDFMIVLSPTIPTILPIILSLLGSIISKIFNNDSFVYINTFFGSISKYLEYLGFLDIKSQTVKNTQEFDKNCKKVILTPNISFMQMFIKYISDNKDTCSYEISDVKEIEMENNESIVEKEIWNYININRDKINIKISSVEFEYTLINGEKILKKYKNSKDNMTQYSNVTRLTDLMPNCELKTYIIEKVKNNSEKYKIIYESFIQQTPDKTCFEMFLLDNILPHCPKLDKFIFLFEFHIMDYLRSYIDNYVYAPLYSYAVKTNKIKIFNFEAKATDIPKAARWSPLGMHSAIVSSRELVSDRNYLEISTELNEYVKSLHNITSCDKQSKESLELIIKSDYDDCDIDLEFGKFINVVKLTTLPQTKGGKIKIFNTSINKIDENQQKNSMTKKEKKDLLAKFDKIEAAQLGQIVKLLNNDNEDKNNSVKKQIVTTQVNEKFKSLNTIYLRELDTKNLTSILNKFKNNNELYEEYGLPNKLGILLYGDPGTGKSSTIQAIASYLNKNIYYVNLGTAETNDDLQMIFNHVNLQSLGGGIIVFEDIDAMTTLVHDRKNQNFVNDNSLLTLEYFLNLLQGSLTMDGTIFIATTNHIEILDPAFYRIGRFDIKIHMKKCDHHQIKNIYFKFVNKHISQAVLEQIKIDMFTPAEIIFHLINHINSDLPDHEIMSTFIK